MGMCMGRMGTITEFLVVSHGSSPILFSPTIPRHFLPPRGRKGALTTDLVASRRIRNSVREVAAVTSRRGVNQRLGLTRMM